MTVPAPRGRTGMVTMGMVVVAGHLLVDPDQRAAYLESCVEIVERARAADGCLDFAISADLVDPSRVNIYERWEGQEALEAFRQGGMADEQANAIRGASVAEYGAVEERVLL